VTGKEHEEPFYRLLSLDVPRKTSAVTGGSPTQRPKRPLRCFLVEVLLQMNEQVLRNQTHLTKVERPALLPSWPNLSLALKDSPTILSADTCLAVCLGAI